MRVLLFGASGLVGQGVLRECLLDGDIEAIRTVGRASSHVQRPKVSHVVHGDFWNFSAIEAQLTPFDACFYCLGVSSVGMKEPEYERVTYGIALATAETLARLNPRMTFILISGAGADSSERGRVMWTRIKGKTENAILRLPFRAAYVFRPGLVVPVHGVESRTPLYRRIYKFLGPILPALHRALPKHVITTEEIGRGMIEAARRGAPKKILENNDIGALARQQA